MTIRLRLIVVGLFMAFALVALRAFQLTMLPDSQLETWRARQFHTQVVVNSRRPSIVDVKGRELALSVESYSLYVDPVMIKNKKKVAAQLARLTQESRSMIYEKIKKSEKRFVWIKRFLSKSQRNKIADLKLAGVGFLPEFNRIYPNDKMSDFLMGRVGSEGRGLSGIELYLDSLVTPQSVTHRLARDAKGRSLVMNDEMIDQLLSDKELMLTLDIDVQHYFENKIRQVRIEQSAQAAFAILLDLENQEIRAMAYDSIVAGDQKLLKNPLLNNVYEFGSVIKPFTIAQALEQKVISSNYHVNLNGGRIQVQDRFIKEAHYDPKFPSMNLEQIIAKSSNIGTAQVAFKLGEKALYQSFLDLGFHQKTGLGLPGESRGILKGLPWSKHLLSNMAFGQGIAITPIQLVTAFSVFGHQGHLKSPRLIKNFKDNLTNEGRELMPTNSHPVFSSVTANQLLKYMSATVSASGTGLNAQIPGFQVAGKTGTAQKALENGRGYKPNAYLSSFIGVFPVDKPRFVLLTAVDEPQKDYYGSQVAAPIFADLGAFLVHKYQLIPSDKKRIQAPLAQKWRQPNEGVTDLKTEDLAQISGVPLQEALQILKNFEVPIRVRGHGDRVSKVEAELNTENQPEALTVIVQ